MFDHIEKVIHEAIIKTEDELNIASLTIKHGLHSFRYGSSEFLNEIFINLPLSQSSIFYDLGSGYGRVLLFGAIQYPNATFKGLEIIEERNLVCKSVAEQLGLKNLFVFNADILNFDLSDGNIFYIYNPLYGFQYQSLLDTLEKVAANKQIIIVAEAKCDIFDKVNWLENYHSMNYDVTHKIKFYKSIQPN